MSPVNFLNPVASTATAVATKQSGNIKRGSAALSSGFADASIDIARTQISNNLSSLTKVQRAVHSALQYAIGMLNTALNSLTSARDQVDNMRAIIAQASSASPEVLVGLDSMYRKGLSSLQQTLDNAAFDGVKLFNHTGALTTSFRTGESVDSVMSVTLRDLRIYATNIRHAEEVIALDNSDPLGISGGVPANKLYVMRQPVGVNGGGNGGPFPVRSRVADTELPQSVVPAPGNPDPFAVAARNAKMTSDSVTEDCGLGFLVVNTNGGYGGYSRGSVVGSILNTLKAVTNITGAGLGTLFIRGVGELGNVEPAGNGAIGYHLPWNVEVATGAALGNYNIGGTITANGGGAPGDIVIVSAAMQGINASLTLNIRNATATAAVNAYAAAIAGGAAAPAAEIAANAAAGAVLGKDVTSTATKNQAVADAVMKSMGNLLDKVIIETRTNLKIAESSSQSLTDSIKVAQETADDLGRADIPTTMADLVNSIKSLQGAVLAQALGNKVVDAVLELVRSA